MQESKNLGMQQWIDTLLKLEEDRNKAKRKFHAHQVLVKKWFNTLSVGDKKFQVGDFVLKWDKAYETKGKNNKFQILWLGPYIIYQQLGLETFLLKSLEGEFERIPVNGQFLKRYLSWLLP